MDGPIETYRADNLLVDKRATIAPEKHALREWICLPATRTPIYKDKCMRATLRMSTARKPNEGRPIATTVLMPIPVLEHKNERFIKNFNCKKIIEIVSFLHPTLHTHTHTLQA